MTHDVGMETATRTQTLTNRLERPIHGRVLAGVAAGIANRAGWSVGLVRLGFIIAAFFGGFGVLLYLAAWALMPEEGQEQSPSERWFDNLSDPNRRTGAILIGIAGAIIIVSLAPITAIAVVALIVGAAMLSGDRQAPSAPATEDAATDTLIDEVDPVDEANDVELEGSDDTGEMDDDADGGDNDPEDENDSSEDETA